MDHLSTWFRCIGIDLPAFGKSPTAQPGLTVPDIAQACWEAMAEVEYFDLSPCEGQYVRCALTARPGVDLRPQVFSLVCERGWRLRELSRSRHSLEDIFARVTHADKEDEP